MPGQSYVYVGRSLSTEEGEQAIHYTCSILLSSRLYTDQVGTKEETALHCAITAYTP